MSKKSHVKDEVFVLAWQEANGDSSVVASKLNLKVASVRLRAKRLRALGVPLKDTVKRAGGHKRTDEDIARLAALISEGAKEEATCQ